MLYPITVGLLYIETNNILKMVFDGTTTYTITMNDAAVSTFTPTAAQFKDIIAIVNDAANC